MRSREAPAAWVRLGTLAAAGLIAVCACGSNPTTAVPTPQQPPTANIKPPTSIGAGEGALNLLDWGGYVQTLWKAPFEQQTGCKINVHDATASDEMVTAMANGGGGQWDMVSASGDIGLRLIYAGDVKPMNPDLIPDWANFQRYFKAPAFNTINGIHYGISLQWGPNTLLFNTTTFPNPPTSWSVIYDPKYKGLITIPDNAMQIADGALYLSTIQTNLGIKDPYELTQKQFDAAVALLKQQQPLVKKYWGAVTDEENLFRSSDAIVGAAWPIMTTDLKASGIHVNDTIPSEGATGWADTWMLATKATHPNCAYLWTKWVSTPLVQAEQSLSFGETPVNTKACAQMESLQAGSCTQFHADAPGSYFNSIKFWKTPIATCPDGTQSCVPYDKWVSAWTAIKG